MNSTDQDRAQRLFKILVGRFGKGAELTRLTEAAANYDDFRVMLMADTKLLPFAAPVVTAWRSQVHRVATAPDANELMHTLEHVAKRQDEIERQLRERDAELLERLRQIDTLSTGVAGLRKEAQQLRQLMIKYRDAVLRLSEPVA